MLDTYAYIENSSVLHFYCGLCLHAQDNVFIHVGNDVLLLFSFFVLGVRCLVSGVRLYGRFIASWKFGLNIEVWSEKRDRSRDNSRDSSRDSGRNVAGMVAGLVAGIVAGIAPGIVAGIVAGVGRLKKTKL